MTRPRLTVIEGDGSHDLVAVLEDALEKAKRGELDLVHVLTLQDGDYFVSYAWKDTLEHPWSLFVAGLADANDQLLADGL